MFPLADCFNLRKSYDSLFVPGAHQPTALPPLSVVMSTMLRHPGACTLQILRPCIAFASICFRRPIATRASFYHRHSPLCRSDLQHPLPLFSIYPSTTCRFFVELALANLRPYIDCTIDHPALPSQHFALRHCVAVSTLWHPPDTLLRTCLGNPALLRPSIDRSSQLSRHTQKTPFLAPGPEMLRPCFDETNPVNPGCFYIA